MAAETPTPLLLLHGFPMDARMWRHTVARFESERPVLAPEAGDLLDPGNPSIAGMARRAIELVDNSGGWSEMVVVGLSMGGYIALEIAAQFPDRLAGLVLCDTRASADTPEAKANREAMAKAVAEKGVLEATSAMREKLLAPMTGEDVRQEIAQMTADRSPAEIAACQMAMRDRADHTGLLTRLHVPALVVVGEHDAIAPVDVAEQMAKSIPNARLAVIPNAGHVPPLENPQAFNEALAEYLGR